MLTLLAVAGSMALLALAVPTWARANSVTASCSVGDSPVNCAVWHSSAVTLRWSWSPSGETGTSGCDTQTFAADTAPTGTSVTCTVTWDAVFGSGTATVLVDRTAPVVSAAIPDRPPDHNGWYNHPVAFSFQGSDSPSGIASCDTVVEAATAGSVTGGCTDLAGNRTTASFPAAYDSTPPAPARVTAAPRNHSISLRWKAPPDVASVQVARSAPGNTSAPAVIYAGTGTHAMDRGLRNGVRYHYFVTVFDQAGNAKVTRLSAVPTASSLRPVNGSNVAAPPRLSWAPARGASYYNVQLMRKGDKILSAWPRGTHLQLPAAWTFRGKRHRLTPGAYRWYVWPGYGPRSAHRYGASLGSGVFRVVP